MCSGTFDVKKYTRTFKFEDKEQFVEINILEVIEPNYGLYTWPSAPVLAQYILKNKEGIQGKRVLEIGAGTALPSLMAVKCGAKEVIISDSSEHVQTRKNCQVCCEMNGCANIPVLPITWGIIDTVLLGLPPLDIILASDCFYDSKDFEDVLVTVSFLLQQNPEAQFWTTYQERSSDRCIESLLRKWNLASQRIPLENFDADVPKIAGSNLPGDHTIHFFLMTRDDG